MRINIEFYVMQSCSEVANVSGLGPESERPVLLHRKYVTVASLSTRGSSITTNRSKQTRAGQDPRPEQRRNQLSGGGGIYPEL